MKGIKDKFVVLITLCALFFGIMALTKLLEEQFSACLIFVACSVWLTAFFKANTEGWCKR